MSAAQQREPMAVEEADWKDLAEELQQHLEAAEELEQEEGQV